MEEAEARKARLAAMRARAGGGTSVAGPNPGLMTPQMLGAPPMPAATRPPAAAPPQPIAPMATTGFYSSLHTPAAATPILEAFSRGDMPQSLPQSFTGGRDRPFPQNHPRGGMGNMGNMGGGGGWHAGMPPPPGPPPRGRGGFLGPPFMQMGGIHRGRQRMLTAFLIS